jgi:hypothetical protein
MPTLVYLYGPPAAGKLTIAEGLAPLTGYRLFHNHLTVNALTPVFDFGTLAFAEVLHRVRLDVLATAAASGIDLIFTNNSVWRGSDGRARFAAFADDAAHAVASAGGRTIFVRVTAPSEVLESRLADESRRVHGKLLHVDRLRELLDGYDLSPLHPDDVTIDSDALAPDEAARAIATALTR